MNDQPSSTDGGAGLSARSTHIHVDAGASFTDFAGWQMPVRYTSDLAEHHAVRTAAGIFDISHMAEILVHGPGRRRLPRLRARRQDLGHHVPARRSTACCSTQGGGVIDDLVVYRIGDDSFFVVANAAQSGRRCSTRSPIAPATSTVDRQRPQRRLALIAVQGPTLARDPRGRPRVSPTRRCRSTSSSTTGALTRSFEGVPLLHRPHRLHGRGRLRALRRRCARRRDLWHALVAAGAPHRARARGPREPRHAAPRGRDAAVRPRARTRHLPGAGRPRPGRRPHARRATSSAAPPIEAGPPDDARVLVGLVSRGQARRPRRLRGCSTATREVGIDHQRRPVADPGLPDRHGLRRRRGQPSHRHHPRASMCAAARARNRRRPALLQEREVDHDRPEEPQVHRRARVDRRAGHGRDRGHHRVRRREARRRRLRRPSEGRLDRRGGPGRRRDRVDEVGGRAVRAGRTARSSSRTTRSSRRPSWSTATRSARAGSSRWSSTSCPTFLTYDEYQALVGE